MIVRQVLVSLGGSFLIVCAVGSCATGVTLLIGSGEPRNWLFSVALGTALVGLLLLRVEFPNKRGE